MILSNTKTDPNKLLPMKYPWAWDHYKTGLSNNWMPEEVPMQNDVETWKSDRLSETERKTILYNLGFFSTAESLTANNLVLALYQHITDPGCRLYLIRQAMEEAVHSHMFVHCCDTFGLDPDVIYDMYNTIPCIREKDQFVINLTQTIFDKNFEIKSDHDVRLLLKDLIGFYVIMEGIFFYGGFAMMLALKRKNIMVGMGEQFNFTLRDESTHLSFGNMVIETIRNENPNAWTTDFELEVRGLVGDAVELETKYIKECCPKTFAGISTNSYIEYIKFIADKRLERLGMKNLFSVKNPLPWMSQSINTLKEQNFFETRVTEYKGAGDLKWE